MKFICKHFRQPILTIEVVIMEHPIFLLVHDSQSPCREIIRQRDGNLRICVFNLDKDHYEPNDDELQFYGTHNDVVLVFETSGYDGTDPITVIEAIRWYADYIDDPQMEILAENPRNYNEGSLY